MTVSVADTFSRAAEHYDDHASLQVQVGRWLLEDGHVSGRALDAGCGTGWVGRQLREMGAGPIVGVDLAEGMLLRAHRCLDVALLADVQCLPIADRSFSSVWANLSLQWVESPEVALSELVRVARSGGWLTFTVPLPGSLREIERAWREAGSERAHINTFAERGQWLAWLTSVVPKAQFEVSCKEFVRHFDGAAEAMRSIKGVGAQRVVEGGSKGMTGVGLYRRALACYERSERRGAGVSLSYRVLKVTAKLP